MTSAILLAAASGFYSSPSTVLPISSKSGIEIPRDGTRALSLRATYPTSGGPYPVIVFSHGMYGSESGADPLVQEWAKRGYVVLQPTHGDSLRYADAETIRAAAAGRLDNTGDWQQRPKEITLLLDRLDWLEQTVPALKGRMDKSKIGMSGHSYGAWTTQMVSGMTLRAGGQALSLGDPRPKAFIVISPQGLGGGVTAESYATMRSPMLFITGDKDAGRGDWDPKLYRRQAYDLSPKGGRTMVWIKDADHGFGGINGRSAQRFMSAGRLGGPPNAEHVKIVQTATLAFWDAQLKGLPAAQTYWSEKPFDGVAGVQVSSK